MMSPSSTSSPELSTIRPQRLSRAMSTIGAKVQSIPAAVASSAAARAVRRARSGSKLAASPKGTGKMVRKPWITSAAKISGTFSRDSRTAAVCIWRAISTPLPLNTPVSRPARTSASCAGKPALGLFGLSASAELPPQAAAMIDSCPAFSLIVMRASASRAAAGRAVGAAACSAARSGVAVQAPARPAAVSTARRDTPSRTSMPRILALPEIRFVASSLDQPLRAL